MLWVVKFTYSIPKWTIHILCAFISRLRTRADHLASYKHIGKWASVAAPAWCAIMRKLSKSGQRSDHPSSMSAHVRATFCIDFLDTVSYTKCNWEPPKVIFVRTRMTCRSYRDELAMICPASPDELSSQFTCIPVTSGFHSVMDAYCEHIIYISMLDKSSLATGARDECTTIIPRRRDDGGVHIHWRPKVTEHLAIRGTNSKLLSLILTDNKIVSIAMSA